MVSCQDEEILMNRVFKDLQERSVISAKRKLVHMKEKPTNRPSFYVRTARLGRPAIAYRFGNGSFDESSLRFILMHEERHVMSPWSWLGPVILITMGAYLALLRLTIFTSVEDRFFSLLIVLGTWYCSLPMLRYGETQADLWSAEKLKSEFGVGKPSEVAFKALTWPQAEENWIRRSVRFVFTNATHPSTPKRVARIARDIDDQPKSQH